MTTAGQQKSPADAIREEQERGARRAAHMAQLARGEFRRDVASTPRELVWSKRKARLYHYFPMSERVQPEPLLVVPWIGISKPYALDLLPDSSFIRAMCLSGYDTYLLDWGEAGDEDADVGFEQTSLDFLPRAIRKTLSLTGAEKLSITAVCLGVPITAAYLALTPDAPVRNLVAMVGPIDFDKGGMFKAWVGSSAFPAETVASTWGGIPTSAMGLGFKLLRPLGDVMAYTNLAWNLDNQAYLPTFQALSDWSNDYVQMPGRFFLQLSRDLYRDNLLMKGQFRVGGRLVDTKVLKLPILVVGAAQDHIAPAPSAKALMDVVSSTDKEYVELPGGHISVFAGRRASRVLFPQVSKWLAVRTPHTASSRG
jgi:polyhydroxyalkanoate synthase